MRRHRLVIFGTGALAVTLAAVFPSCRTKTPSAANVVTDTIFDTEYLRRVFFRVDTLIGDPITDLRVYVDDANPYNNACTLRCLATIDPFHPAETTAYSGDRHDGYFELARADTDYLFDMARGLLDFVEPIASNCAIGVSYVSGSDTVGGFYWVNPQNGESLLVLKLVKPVRASAASQTYALEMKNAYSLGASDIALDSIKVVRWGLGENPRENVDENGGQFLHIIGLDPDNDGIVVSPQLDSHRGYLVCATTYPFIAESLTVKDSIYWPADTSSYPHPKYRFVVKYSRHDSSGLAGRPSG